MSTGDENSINCLELLLCRCTNNSVSCFNNHWQLKTVWLKLNTKSRIFNNCCVFLNLSKYRRSLNQLQTWFCSSWDFHWKISKSKGSFQKWSAKKHIEGGCDPPTPPRPSPNLTWNFSKYFWSFKGNKPKMAYSRDLSKMAIKDDQGLSWPNKDYQGLSRAVKDYQRLHGLSWSVMDSPIHTWRDFNHGLSRTIMNYHMTGMFDWHRWLA